MAGRICILLICALAAQVCLQDPCDNYHILPNDGLRYLNNRIDHTYNRFEDTFLEPGWYKSCEKMPEEPPESIYMCGTKFPIWLMGEHPVNSTPVSRTACLRDIFEEATCSRSYTLHIAMCDDGCFGYLLVPTVQSSGYCFGIGINGTRPQFEPVKPVVNAGLTRRTLAAGFPVTETVFVCDFNKSTEENLLYMVHWYKDGIQHYNTPLAEESTDETLHITENEFEHKGFNMGMELSCSVTAFVIENGPPSKRSEQSNQLFVGIKVLTPELAFDAGDIGEIRFQPTVPIGCKDLGQCYISLITHVPYTRFAGECQTIAFKDCEIKIFNYTNEHKFSVVANDNAQPIEWKTSKHEIFCKVKETVENSIWGNYELPSIGVTINYGPSATVPNTKCVIENDPHYTNFDGRRFDDHTDGTKTVYLHVVYNTEVQVRYRQCNNSPHIRCLCGVAVRAGYDVYVINICDGDMVGYLYCSMNGRALTVKAKDNETRIHFNYGTYVLVIKEADLLKAYIYPSTKDRKNTRGLCGSFDNNIHNDFHDRDGNIMPDDYHTQYPDTHSSNPEEFIQHWTISASRGEDLFDESFDARNLQEYNISICICEGGTGAINNEINCTQNGATTCSQGTPVRASQCPSISTNNLYQPFKAELRNVIIQNVLTTNQRKKRQTAVSTWTEEAAMDYCINRFHSNNVYNLCSQIPSVKPDKSIDVCAIDIQITNGTGWVQSSLNGMASECREELVRNVTIVREDESGETLYDVIKNVTCPNNCSENGQCVEGKPIEKGKCICDDGIGASDCSLDLTVPPTMAGLLDGGLCDKRQRDCNTTLVFGGAFVDSHDLFCKMQEFNEDEAGMRTYGTINYVSPYFETYVELEVSLDDLVRSGSTVSTVNSFIYGYSISVTNDGQAYSDSTDFFIYDSECQLVQELNNSWQFTLQDGYCFIDNQCFVDGLANAEDTCYFCNASSSPKVWSLDVAKTGCVINELKNEEDDNTNAIPIIVGSVVGGIVFAAILIAATVKVLKKVSRSKREIGASTLFDIGNVMIRAERSMGNTHLTFQKQQIGLAKNSGIE